jgi:hypothetical protein
MSTSNGQVAKVLMVLIPIVVVGMVGGFGYLDAKIEGYVDKFWDEIAMLKSQVILNERQIAANQDKIDKISAINDNIIRICAELKIICK